MTIQPHKINPQLLPQLLQELAELVGLAAALALAEHANGVTLYVPAKARADHPLAGIMGFEAFERLCDYYAQETLRMPKVDAAIRQIKHQVVADMAKRNCSIRETALATGYTSRRVEQLRAECRKHNQPPQQDLFAAEANR